MATKISQNSLREVKRWYSEDALTMKQIADRLSVSLDAVTYFMRKNSIPRRKNYETRKICYERQSPSFHLQKINSEKLRKLKLAGVMLYWAEGAKRGKEDVVDFANSDAEMIRIFMRFLREICGVNESRLRIFPYLYANQDRERNMQYWSRVTGVPLKQFTKPYVRKDYQVEREGRMPYGMVHVRYADKKLFRVMLQWIDKCKKKF